MKNIFTLSAFLVLIIVLASCNKDSSNDPTPTATGTSATGGGNGGGSSTVKFSYLRDNELIEHTDQDFTSATNHNEPTNKYVNAVSSKDSTYNGLIVSSVNIEIGIWGFQMDEIIIDQEYYFDDPDVASEYGYIDYSFNIVAGGSSSYYTDDGSAGFIKVTNVNLIDSTFSGEYEGVLWEDGGAGYLVIENGTFSDVKFSNLN